MKSFLLLSVVLPILLSSCANIEQINARRKEIVLSRATFDLDCAKEKIEVTPIASRAQEASDTFGVTGCGKRATYLYDPTRGQAIMNSPKDSK
ncbi:MAG: hypothetical protein A2X86_16435 [Bdellovibrionales bacterium GWA2_49_15]|nr:MAG: hypothetical protein A2X86_16435 [Bdellovibrionales bacterium GWA2_49_15]HAZ13693.1 hypothetical protein [Bdellovibrionales bacterium]